MSVFIGLSLQQAVLAKDAPPPATADQLAQRFKSALQAKDRNAVLALFNWDGVADWVKEDTQDDVDDWLTRNLKGVNLAPLPADFSPTNQTQNLRFWINVKPVGVVEAHFTDGFGVGYPYGKNGDRYYIASVHTEEIPVSENATNKFLIINVRTADGSPLPQMHITAVGGTPDRIPHLHFKALMGSDFLTDEQGRLNLPQPPAKLFVVIANRSGFGWLPNEDLTNGATLVVHPWAGIEGAWRNRNKPMAGETLELSVDKNLYPVPPVLMDHVETVTDANGRFLFTNAPPLKLLITRLGTAIASLDMTAGGTKKLEILTHGRTVLGKVGVGNGFDTNIDLSNFSGALDSAIRNSDGSRQTFHFQTSSNGDFELNPIEPGDYTISGNLWQDNRHVADLDPVSIHVPADTPESADAPFDIGAVALTPVVHLKVGDLAPGFTATTVDGRTLRLSDFRGRYVLLDFWATWCFWCVKEIPNMKATWDDFGADKRLAMVSLSLDADPALPARYAKIHDIHWTQGFLGDWSDNKVTPKYGVFGIPSIFLIGPDGRIVATGLRGPKIKEAVASALAQ